MLMHAYRYYLTENLSLHRSHTNTLSDEDVPFSCNFFFTPVNKSVCKENYIQQKIKKLSSNKRSYSVCKYSDTACGKRVSDSHSDACFLSYYSKGNEINYNGKFSCNDEKIVCRHFSYWWVNKKKPNFDDISSQEKIINNREVCDFSVIKESFFLMAIRQSLFISRFTKFLKYFIRLL